MTKTSLHQLRYVGEWHSHPTGSSVWPSHIDIEKLAWLDSEPEAAEGVPAPMAIAGDDCAFSFMLIDDRRGSGKSVRTRGGQPS